MNFGGNKIQDIPVSHRDSSVVIQYLSIYNKSMCLSGSLYMCVSFMPSFKVVKLQAVQTSHFNYMYKAFSIKAM